MKLLSTNAVILAGGLDAFVSFIKSLASSVKQGSLAVYDIVMYLCFAACVILVLVTIIANNTGKNVGFAAGDWAIRSAIAAGCLFAAKQIFGI